jgi:uncharacterized protein
MKHLLSDDERNVHQYIKDNLSNPHKNHWGLTFKDIALYLGIYEHSLKKEDEFGFHYLDHLRFKNGKELYHFSEWFYNNATQNQIELGKAYVFSLIEKPVLFVSVRWIDSVFEYGCFAEKEFKPGELIGEYTGVVKCIEECDPENSYHFEYINTKSKGEWYVDAREYGNWTRFINHSTFPNVDVIMGVSRGVGHLLFVAWRSIEKGEQLLYNYGENYWKFI